MRGALSEHPAPQTAAPAAPHHHHNPSLQHRRCIQPCPADMPFDCAGLLCTEDVESCITFVYEIGDFIITSALNTYDAVVCVSSLIATAASEGALSPVSVASCAATVLKVAVNAAKGVYGLVSFKVCETPPRPGRLSLPGPPANPK